MNRARATRDRTPVQASQGLGGGGGVRRMASLASTGLLAATALSFLLLMYARMRRPDGNDLTVYLRSAEALIHGGDPYRLDVPQGHGPYPLTIDTLAIPLTWVPQWLAQAIWFGVNVAGLLGALLVLERLWRAAEPARRGDGKASYPVRLAAVVLALLVPLQSHLTRGQVNLVALGLCTLFLRAQLSGRPVSSGLWLGGAIALKLTPLVFTVGLARERKYRALIAAASSTVLCAVGLPTLVSSHVVAIYWNSWTQTLGREVTGPVSFSPWSRFTLAAVLVRTWPGLVAVPGLRYLVALIVLAFLYWVHGRVAGDARGQLLAFALALVAIPLVTPKSENHHLAILVGALWVWLLAAEAEPSWRALDVTAATLFLGAAWVGAHHPDSVLDALALVVLFVVLAVRTLSWPRSRGPSVVGDRLAPALPPSAGGPPPRSEPSLARRLRGPVTTA